MDCSPLGSSVHEIFQAKILEWVAISFSRASSQLKIEPGSSALQADSLTTELQGKPRLNHSHSLYFDFLTVKFSLRAKADVTINDISVSLGMRRCKNWNS